jgi:hypothetical protein
MTAITDFLPTFSHRDPWPSKYETGIKILGKASAKYENNSSSRIRIRLRNRCASPKKTGNTSHNPLLGAALGFHPRSGLRPNCFWGMPGNSDWASAALTFAEVFSCGLRQFASARLHCLLRAGIPGGRRPPLHSRPRKSGMRQNQLRPAARCRK